MKIPMSSPDLSDKDLQAVTQVLETCYLSDGPKIKEFEEELGAFINANYATGVNSGTSGLHLAVISAGISEGDLVITTPFSFIASANCLLYERAVPVFVDIDPLTYNINPDLVAQAAYELTKGGPSAKKWFPRQYQGSGKKPGRLKAILAVDVFGQPADYEQLQSTANNHELLIIEDSCEALGSEYNGRKAGMLGDVGVFGFYPNKQITTAEGGMLVTDNQDWADSYRSLRNQGRDLSIHGLVYKQLGYNYRMDEMSAALGLSQLTRIEEMLDNRARVAEWYNQRLVDVPGIQIPIISSTTTRMSWFVYVIRVQGTLGRNQVVDSLNQDGIPSRPYFSPIHLQSFYRDTFGYQGTDYPETELAGDQCLALPFSSVMTEDQVDFVCKALKTILESV